MLGADRHSREAEPEESQQGPGRRFGAQCGSGSEGGRRCRSPPASSFTGRDSHELYEGIKKDTDNEERERGRKKR
ncbi:hypothetical protein Pmani_013028 [Petrolisthes manimaculis]|uniref:Uncharacterized protein n=1 Tax=Petrolisthes manimaculis TaxID=1843537 RepID=A0AAE1PVT8_9EUCA|nr:hypothetical protein Pmani_013028 [Petrolisthes manimaculis]